MKRDFGEILRKVQLLMTAALAVYPIHWIAAALLGGVLVPWVWLWTLEVMIFGTLALFVPGKLRIIFGGAAVLAVVGSAVVLSGEEHRLACTVQAVLAALQVLWSLQLAGWDRKNEISGFWIGAGIAAHLTCQILLLTQWAAEFPDGMLRLSFYGYVLLTMFSVNRGSLVEASGKRGSVPGALRRRNMALIFTLFVISLVGGLLPSAFVLVKDSLLRVLRWMGKVIEAMLAQRKQPADMTYDQSTGALPEAVEEERGMMELPPVLQTVILYIGAAISIAFVLWLLFTICKKVWKAARSGLNLFGKFLSAASEDYVDEITDTRDTGDPEAVKARRRIPRRYRKDPALPPGEQVRKRYAHLRQTHPQWSPGSTAREKLPRTAAEVYERARYSGHPVSAEEASFFHEEVQDL